MPLAPPAASTAAEGTDTIFFGLMIISGLVVVLVATLIVVFALRYRRGREVGRGALKEVVSREFEVTWTVATLLVFLFLFAWAATQQFTLLNPPPPNAIPIHVVAKQWMWKVEHPGGQREINALHVPVHRPVRLAMNSQDVIHSFYVPAFRLKKDIVPGLTENLWFEATKPGTYDLFCSEFCGTDHSHMMGEIVAMEPQDFSRWLSTQPQHDDIAKAGEVLFRELGCSGCHGAGARIRAPPLEGVYNHPVPLADGRVIVADDAYVRDSILMPKKDVVASYEPVMPSFAGRVSEADLLALVAYVRSLADKGASR